MNQERTHSINGTSLSEWVNQIPSELPMDAVGLWQFIPSARKNFGLEGEDLTSLVERVIHSLLQHGARPVRGGKGTDHDWIEQTHYGTQPSEIVHKIIGEWSGWGYANPTVDGIWFALPELFG